jgi:hypothetical protein
MPLRRELTEPEKQEILGRHGMYCFINGHPIESEDDLHFDHIRPIASGGPTELENIAPVCSRHNLQKRTMSLSEYRDYLSLSAFFDDGSPKYLDDVMASKGLNFGQSLEFEIVPCDDSIILYFNGRKQAVSLYHCPTTHWRYFYALIPVPYLKNDKELQPRPLRQKSLWGLYRHFQRNTQLSPSICRLEHDGNLFLFDGQHKAAAQIWNGRGVVECKVYLEPIAKKLKETNLEAHEAYRQMAFYSAELMQKYADIFGEDWSDYAQLEGRKSEKGFVDFLIEFKKMTAAKAKGEVERAVHWRILDDSENKLSNFISDKSRARRQPLTYNRVKKTVFRDFLSPIPSSAEFESEQDLRSTEERNLVRLMNIIAEECLIDRWAPERADAIHERTERFFSAGAIRAWSRILRDVLFAHLQLYRISPDEVNRVLYRKLENENFTWIRRFVRQIFSHPAWDEPNTPNLDISKALTKDDDVTALTLLKERGLTVDWVLRKGYSDDVLQ